MTEFLLTYNQFDGDSYVDKIARIDLLIEKGIDHKCVNRPAYIKEVDYVDYTYTTKRKAVTDKNGHYVLDTDGIPMIEFEKKQLPVEEPENWRGDGTFFHKTVERDNGVTFIRYVLDKDCYYISFDKIEDFICFQDEHLYDSYNTSVDDYPDFFDYNKSTCYVARLFKEF